MKQDRMIKLREQGRTLKDIAEAAGVCIKKVFDLTGGRQGPERKPYAKQSPRNFERDNRIRENVEGGLLQTEVARMENLSCTRIQQIVSKGRIEVIREPVVVVQIRQQLEDAGRKS